ncbi:MAG: hypothetical protein LH645_06775 [Actinomycetia bacterium]|nr:hypothetical protein [Actinomycetes bacterium]
MKWLRRRGSGSPESPGRTGKTSKTSKSEDRKYLEEFIATRRGVEAYVEPQTAVSATTIVLVAADGEWTRRPVPDAATAFTWAHKHGIPCYDVNLMGYPKRMREWNGGA